MQIDPIFCFHALYLLLPQFLLCCFPDYTCCLLESTYSWMRINRLCKLFEFGRDSLTRGQQFVVIIISMDYRTMIEQSFWQLHELRMKPGPVPLSFLYIYFITPAIALACQGKVLSDEHQIGSRLLPSLFTNRQMLKFLFCVTKTLLSTINCIKIQWFYCVYLNHNAVLSPMYTKQTNYIYPRLGSSRWFIFQNNSHFSKF